MKSIKINLLIISICLLAFSCGQNEVPKADLPSQLTQVGPPISVPSLPLEVKSEVVVPDPSSSGQ